MLSRTSLGIAAAGAGLCFLGYCIYFDKKRRGDPNFRQKLKERRKNAANKMSATGNASTTKYPDMTNQEACQQYFMQEIQLGELLLANGQTDEAIEHLANAVVVCGQPQHLMSVFTQTLPPEVVQRLAQKLPIVQKRMMESQAMKMGAGGPPNTQEAKAAPTATGPVISELAEDDVE